MMERSRAGVAPRGLGGLLGWVTISAAVAALGLAPCPARGEAGGGRQGILFEGTFESGDLTGFYWHHNRPEVVSADAHPVRAGRYAMRSYLHRHESESPYRTEVIVGASDRAPEGTRREFLMAMNEEYWIGFSVYLPPDFVPDHERLSEIVFQMQASPDPDERYRSPVFGLEIDDSEWRIILRWDTRPTSPQDNSFTGSTTVHRAPLGRSVGNWTDWVVHARWSYGDDGLTRVWRDGELVLDRQGPNASNDRQGPLIALGLYKWPWRPEYAYEANVDWRLVYHDEFRIGDASASYEDVAPGERPAPAPSPTEEPTRTLAPTPTPTPTPAPRTLRELLMELAERLRALFTRSPR